MFRDEDLTDNSSYGIGSSVIGLLNPDSGQSVRNPDEKIGFSRTSLELLGDSEMGKDQGRSKPSRPGNLVQDLDKPSETVDFPKKKLEFLGESGMDPGRFQPKPGNSSCEELTLSYLCDNSKWKEAALENLSQQQEKWVERDFLQLSDSKGGGSSKQEPEEGSKGGGVDCNKKPKLEALKLSLALPDVSLSLTASNVAPNGEAGAQLKPSRSVHSLGISNDNNNTQTTCSNDFTAASLSYSYSHPFSHNPSCSLTRNSTENYEYSVGSCRRETDQIWHCGEGTNGSVHSRFKPIGNGDGTGLSNGTGVGSALLNRGHPFNRDFSNNLCRTAGSDSGSFFPSELPARPKMETTYTIIATLNLSPPCYLLLIFTTILRHKIRRKF